MPDLATPILDVFLDNTFLPASRPIAEFQVEQVVIAHCMEAGVDGPFFAKADFVDRSFHVVVNAVTRHPAESDEGTGVRIEQHLVTLGVVSNQVKCPACSELHMCHFEAPA